MSYGAIAPQVAGQLRELRDAVRPAIQTLEQAVRPFQTPAFLAQVREFAEMFERVGEWLKTAPEQLRQGLEDDGTIPHPELSLGDLARVTRAFDDRGKEGAVEVLNTLHSDLFADEDFMRRLKVRWSGSNRAPVLEQILAAHEAGLYAVSVPAGLAQAEGVVVDAVGHKGTLTAKMLLQHLATLSPDAGVHGPVVAQFINKFLFMQFHHGSSVPLFSRHAILHGADIRYGTKSNSLRTLIWIDYLLVLVRERDNETVGPLSTASEAG